MNFISKTIGASLLCWAVSLPAFAQQEISSEKLQASQSQKDSSSKDNATSFSFDNSLSSDCGKYSLSVSRGQTRFEKGLENRGLEFSGKTVEAAFLKLKELEFGNEKDFSIQFWVKSTVDSNKTYSLLGTKGILSNRLAEQKKKGWLFFVRDGTWAWNIGSGRRRLTYERSNGQYMPINDGRWHQLTMTYDHRESLVRIYFDGINKATYWVGDSKSFPFTTGNQLILGWPKIPTSEQANGLPVLNNGRQSLQQMVDLYHSLELSVLKPDEFLSLVTRPSQYVAQKFTEKKKNSNPNDDTPQTLAKFRTVTEKLNTISKGLMKSKYTVHQSRYFMEVATITRLYKLIEGKVEIQAHVRDSLLQSETLVPGEFTIDKLKIWQKTITPEEVARSYSKHFLLKTTPPAANLKKLIVGSWNIYHGGIHMSMDKDGWDSRDAIVELIRREKIDVLMMQETYSTGDHIAAELGYYFATTIDWDNMSQGSNISVLSRFPIKSITVPPKSTFMSVAAKVSISRNQDLYAISSWFGMRNFSDVFQFHKSKFLTTDKTPVIIAGDFNAVPHTDGGRSPASRKLQDTGFSDAYRELFPDPKSHPGSTHRSGRRIDQIYYKGIGLKNTETKVFSKWPSGFPSDHYLIKTIFQLDFRSKD